MVTTKAAKIAGWTIRLGGSERALVPSVPALLAIERATGRTLFGLVDRARAEGFTLSDMAVIAIALVGAGAEKESDAAMQFEAVKNGIAGEPVERMTAQLADLGLIEASARLLSPLVAALTGAVDASGVAKG